MNKLIAFIILSLLVLVLQSCGEKKTRTLAPLHLEYDYDYTSTMRKMAELKIVDGYYIVPLENGEEEKI